MILGEKIFILVFVILKFSEFPDPPPPPPPPFENPAYTTALSILKNKNNKNNSVTTDWIENKSIKFIMIIYVL